jgi:hypothetical protein
MAEPLEGTKATEEEIDKLMEYLGYPNSKPAAKPVEQTEESIALDNLFKNMGI